MDERSVRCGECGAVEPESRTFDVPIYRDEPSGWIDGYRCRGCFAKAVDITRRRLQYTDAEDGDEGELEILMLAAFLRARRSPLPALDGAELKAAAIRMLDEIERGTRRLVPDDRTASCSGCSVSFPESQLHVIPWFNDELQNYVTTFRCGGCFSESLEQTRARLSVTDDDDELARAAELFERHGIFILEYRRGDSPQALKPILIGLVERVRSESIVLKIGETPSIGH